VGILAVGDGIATLAGRALGGPRWPWNREKTLSGSAAFAIGGAVGGIFLAWWCRPALAHPPAFAFTIAAPSSRRSRPRSSKPFPSGSTTTCRSP
jgi:dolichol kinase